MCRVQEHPVMGTHAPGRVMSMIKQQAAMLTHHQWAQVRAALSSKSPAKPISLNADCCCRRQLLVCIKQVLVIVCTAGWHAYPAIRSPCGGVAAEEQHGSSQGCQAEREQPHRDGI